MITWTDKIHTYGPNSKIAYLNKLPVGSVYRSMFNEKGTPARYIARLELPGFSKDSTTHPTEDEAIQKLEYRITVWLEKANLVFKESTNA